MQIEACSSVYETEPVGEVLDQGDYLNAVVRVATTLGPLELLDVCKRIEAEMGRTAGPRHGPRPIDLDVLLVGDEVLDSERMRLPHPEVTSRRFVLVPLLELDPELRIAHLRLMGSSDRGIYRGRLRWGRGQWFMGSAFPYVVASGLFRMREKPYGLGGLLIIAGYLGAALRGRPRYGDRTFRRELQRWQYARLRGLARGAGAR